MHSHMVCRPCSPESLFFWGMFVISSMTHGGRSPGQGAAVGDTEGRTVYLCAGGKEPPDTHRLLSQSRGRQDRSRCPTPSGTRTQPPHTGSEGPSRHLSPHVAAAFPSHSHAWPARSSRGSHPGPSTWKPMHPVRPGLSRCAPRKSHLENLLCPRQTSRGGRPAREAPFTWT